MSSPSQMIACNFLLYFFFFLYIFVYSYLLDLTFFSQRDPVDYSTWNWRVILDKYSIITIIIYDYY